MAKVTLAKLKQVARSTGCTVRKTVDGEYRVNRMGNSEATAYYTTDAEDAARTMSAMQCEYIAKRLAFDKASGAV